MLLIIKCQLVIGIVLSVLAYLFYDFQVALSLGLGGLSYIVPTGISILILKFLRSYPVYAGAGFVITEILKIILVLMLMVMVVLVYQELLFLPFLIGLLSVSHFVFLYILKVDKYGK